jgi:hypothetical protein
VMPQKHGNSSGPLKRQFLKVTITTLSSCGDRFTLSLSPFLGHNFLLIMTFAGDEEALALWRKFRDLSIVEYKKIYGRLNVSFDVYSGESLQGPGMVRALKELEEKTLLEDSKGAKIINLEVRKINKKREEKKEKKKRNERGKRISTGAST